MLIKLVLLFLLPLLTQTISGQSIELSKRHVCPLEYHGQKLHEGDVVDIHGKFYKVEDCALHRAYHVCGTHIIYIINIVCHAVEQQKPHAGLNRYSRFVQQKLLTEACCQSLCTVSEMTRYCPH